MTAHQRRPGFRLPWSSEEEAAAAADAQSAATPVAEEPAEPASDASSASAEPTTPVEPTPDPEAAAAAAAAQPAEAEPAPTAAPRSNSEADASPDFMHDLVVAMRAVADEARQAGVTEAKAAVDDQVKRLESDAERRREDLRARADADIAGIGEWAAAEAERIKAEAEQRVVARRTQLDQQLSGETGRVEAESKSLRDRVSEYERELDAYHAQLGEISDPAAFAAAAKRMPRPPSLEARPAPVATSATTATAGPEITTAVETPSPSRPPTRTASRRPPPRSIRLRSRCLRAGWRSSTRRSPTRRRHGAIPSGEPTTTEIVVSAWAASGRSPGSGRRSLASTGSTGWR